MIKREGGREGGRLMSLPTELLTALQPLLIALVLNSHVCTGQTRMVAALMDLT